MDGTVGDLSSPATAARIATTGLPVKVVVIRRDPVKRFVSAETVLRSKHAIPAQARFGDFLKDQIDGHARRDPRRRQVTEGPYTGQIQRWRRDIDPADIQTIDFDNLVASSGRVCARILEFCGLDASPADRWVSAVSKQTDRHRNAAIDRTWRYVMAGLSVTAQTIPRLYTALHRVAETTLARPDV